MKTKRAIENKKMSERGQTIGPMSPWAFVILMIVSVITLIAFLIEV